MKQNLLVVRWVGLAILVIEVISILIAYSLSSAQQRLVRQYRSGLLPLIINDSRVACSAKVIPVCSCAACVIAIQ